MKLLCQKHVHLFLLLLLNISFHDSYSHRARSATKKFITNGCKIKANTGIHFCPKNARQQRNLDPRAETVVRKNIPVAENEYLYMFHALFHIKRAKQTTIMQFLNVDRTDPDVYKPVFFLVAWLNKGNKTVKLCMFEDCMFTWDDLPRKFYISFLASGKRVYLKISGYPLEQFDLVSPLNGAYRPNGVHSVRWGVYHHDVVDGVAQTAAKVGVSNIFVNF